MSGRFLPVYVCAGLYVADASRLPCPRWRLRRLSAAAGGYAPAGGPRGYLQGGPVGFTDAIKLAFQNIFEYNGRASRSSSWWFALAELIGWVGVLILAVIFAAVHAPVLSILLYLAAAIASFLVSLALTIRRLHDQDKSGFWYFIAFVPFIGGICSSSLPSWKAPQAPTALGDRGGQPVSARDDTGRRLESDGGRTSVTGVVLCLQPSATRAG